MSLFTKIFGKQDTIKLPIQTTSTDKQTDPTPPHPDLVNSEPGFMAIDDVLSIKGRGTVVVGRVDIGNFYIGQSVTVNTSTGPIQTTIIGIESFRKIRNYATAGDNVGLLLKDVEKNLINRDDTIRGM